MEPTYVFFYFMVDDVERIKSTIGPHVAYWKSQSFEYYRGGPFTDKSGGLIIFTSENYSEAEDIVRNDPFIKEGALREYWLKEWIP